MGVSKLSALLSLLFSGAVFATVTDPNVLDACPGYKASHVTTHGAQLTADLTLAGKACNVFGSDIEKLKLQVSYETSEFIFPYILSAASPRLPFRHAYTREDHRRVCPTL